MSVINYTKTEIGKKLALVSWTGIAPGDTCQAYPLAPDTLESFYYNAGSTNQTTLLFQNQPTFNLGDASASVAYNNGDVIAVPMWVWLSPLWSGSSGTQNYYALISEA